MNFKIILFKVIFSILLLALIFPASAEPTVYAPNTTILLNTSLTIPIEIANFENSTGVSFQLSYDANILTILNVSVNQSFPDSLLYYNIDDGNLNLAVISTKKIITHKPTPLIDLRVKAVSSGTSDLILSEVEYSDSNFISFSAKAVNGSITVLSLLPTPTPTPSPTPKPSAGAAGGGGGGGGGGPPILTNPFYYAFAVSKYLPKPEWFDIPVPENYANLTNILKFSLKFAKNTYADIRFSKVIKPKEGISMPPIDLYQFNEICIVKFGTREKVYPEEAYIEFRVEKSWINEGGYSFDDIAMFRWNNESREWEELKTEFVNQDESFAYYKAYMQGFSLFAIGVKVKQPEVIPTATPTVKPTVTPALTPTPKPTAKPAATPTLTPTTTPTLKPWWQIPGFEVIFALVAIAVAYLVRR